LKFIRFNHDTSDNPSVEKNSYFDKIKNIFIEEKNWEAWKDESCLPFEKFPNQEDILNIQNIRKKIEVKEANEETKCEFNNINPVYKNDSPFDYQNLLLKNLINDPKQISKVKVNFDYNEVNFSLQSSMAGMYEISLLSCDNPRTVEFLESPHT
jgi:hypothetical protein